MNTAEIFDNGEWVRAPVFQRLDLQPGDIISGPAIIVEAIGTNLVDDGWQAEVTVHGHLFLSKTTLPKTANPGNPLSTMANRDRPDPVMLEIFNNLFVAVAEQMGITLQNTASSVNIKERLDFSCAVFDHQGGLVANAPHIPVHLGSMGESVQALIKSRRGRFQPGDVFASNNPFCGGTHLPDTWTFVVPSGSSTALRQACCAATPDSRHCAART